MSYSGDHPPPGSTDLRPPVRSFLGVVALVSFVLACFAAFRDHTPELAAVGFLAFSAVAALLAGHGRLPWKLGAPGGFLIDFLGPDPTTNELRSIAEGLIRDGPGDVRRVEFAARLRRAARYEDRVLRALRRFASNEIKVIFDSERWFADGRTRTDAVLQSGDLYFVVDVKSSIRSTSFYEAGSRLVDAVEGDSDVAGGILITDYAPAEPAFVTINGRPIYTIASDSTSVVGDVLRVLAYYRERDSQ